MKSGRIGVLLLNLGTPDGTGYWPMRRYLKEFLSDRRVIEVPRWKWWPILNLIILTVRPGPQGQGLRQDLEQGAQRGAAQDHHARAGREARRRARRRAHRGRLGHALRQSEHGAAGIAQLQREGCDRILIVPLYPQYAAATTATACDEAFRALMRTALAAGGAGGAALLRRSRLHRRAGGLDPRPPRRPRLRARGADRLLPRHAAALPGERRPLPLPVPEDLAAAARAARLAATSAGTPPSSRASATSRGCSPTPSRRWSGWRRVGRQAARHRRPGLLRRLPGDAGGARHGEPRRLPGQRRREVHLRPLPQRQRAGHARHRARRAARADGLALTAGMPVAAVRAANISLHDFDWQYCMPVHLPATCSLPVISHSCPKTRHRSVPRSTRHDLQERVKCP